MASFLTRYILQNEGRAPDKELFESVLEKLAGLLRAELRRRGLFSAPPRFLGIVGRSFSDEDTFTDLLYDAYAFAILDRFPALLRRAKKGDIDGAVRVNVRLFLFERQRQQDPVGYRVFDIAREAIRQLVDREQLRIDSGADDGKITARTVLSLPPFDDAAITDPLDEDLVARWCERLMPDLVTSYHRQGVVERLRHLVQELPESDVSAFLLRGLVNPLKALARRRTIALLTGGEAVKRVDEDGRISFDFVVRPRARFEERQALRRLLDCIRSSIDRRDSAKERNYLHRLLDFLASWSAMMDEGPARERPGDAELSRQLDIPRGRIPQLLATLSDMTSACRGTRRPSEADAEAAGRPPRSTRPPAARKDSMSLDKRREALRRATGAAGDAAKKEESPTHEPARREQEGPAGEIRPADIVTWSGPPEPFTEWLVVSWSDDGGKLVPVDTAPLRGSRDLDLSSAAGEPLFARCGQAVWVSAQTELESAWRLPGAEAPRALEAVSACLESLEDETPPMLEIDDSPVYLEHLETVAAARERLLASATDTQPSSVASFAEHRSRRGGGKVMSMRHLGTLLAAAFALVALGLGLHSAHLSRQLDLARQELDRSQGPHLYATSDNELLYIGTTRSGPTTTLRPVGDRVRLDLVFTTSESYPSYRITWAERESGVTLFEAPLESEDSGLDVPATDGFFDLTVYGVQEDGTLVEIHSQSVRIIVDRENSLP